MRLDHCITGLFPLSHADRTTGDGRGNKGVTEQLSGWHPSRDNTFGFLSPFLPITTLEDAAGGSPRPLAPSCQQFSNESDFSPL